MRRACRRAGTVSEVARGAHAPQAVNRAAKTSHGIIWVCIHYICIPDLGRGFLLITYQDGTTPDLNNTKATAMKISEILYLINR